MKESVYCRIIMAVFCFLLSLSCTTFASDQSGEKLFQAMKCTGCHDAEIKKRGPSLQKIARVYPDQESIFLYFTGKADPIVEPEREKTMRPRLRKIMKLNEAEKKALATYINTFKK